MGCGFGIWNGRRTLLLSLGISALVSPVIALNVGSYQTLAPNHADSLPQTLSNPESHLRANLLERQQYSCPNPSTEQFCDPNFCFLVQNDGAGSWGTCCPAGSSLMLYGGGEDHWTSQKCCPSGSSVEQCMNEDISSPPMRPLQCGNGGVVSGWTCVYGSSSGSESSTKSMAGRSWVVMAITGVIWIAQWY